MSTESMTAGRTLLESMIAQDMTTALTALHPDCLIHEPDSLWYSGDWKGPEGFQRVVELISSKLDLTVTSYQLYDSGDRTIMNAQVGFVSKLNGRTLDMSVVEIYQARDGQLIDMDIYYKDTAALNHLANHQA